MLVYHILHYYYLLYEGVEKLPRWLHKPSVNLVSKGSRRICFSWMCCCGRFHWTRTQFSILCCRIPCWGNCIWRTKGMVCTWFIPMGMSYLSSPKWCSPSCGAKTASRRIWMEAHEGCWWLPATSATFRSWIKTMLLLQWTLGLVVDERSLSKIDLIFSWACRSIAALCNAFGFDLSWTRYKQNSSYV